MTIISKSLDARDNIMMEILRAPSWVIDAADVVVEDRYEEELGDQESAERPNSRVQEEVVGEYGYVFRFLLQGID